MSEKENAEKIQEGTVTPAPSKEATAIATETKPVAEPVESPAEKQNAKVTAAFIAQRKKIKELEAKATAAPVTTPPSATPTEQVEEAIAVVPPTPQAPAPVTAENSADDAIEKQALAELANDKELAKVTMGVVEVLEMIDNDPRLTKLYKIDPKLAIREAKGEYMSKLGITNASPVPVSTAPSGGMGSGSVDLEAMYAAIDGLKPGTMEWHKLANKIDAELKK